MDRLSVAALWLHNALLHNSFDLYRHSQYCACLSFWCHAITGYLRFVIRSRQSEQVRLQGAAVDDNERSCALRYQQSIVEVYAHFYVSIGDEKQYLANR